MRIFRDLPYSLHSISFFSTSMMARRTVSEPATGLCHHIPWKTPEGRDDPNPQVAFLAVARVVSLLPSYATEKMNEGTSGGRRGGGQPPGRVRPMKASGNQT